MAAKRGSYIVYVVLRFKLKTYIIGAVISKIYLFFTLFCEIHDTLSVRIGVTFVYYPEC